MSTIATLSHPKAGKPSHQHVYRDEDGKPVLVANRYDRDGRKFFLPYDLVKGTWTAPEHRPLYRLDELIAANENRPVIITEGEKCADALASLGYVATTTFGGANAAEKSDISAMKDRTVILWPDKDEPGRKYAEGLAVTLYKAFGIPPRIIPTTDVVLGKVRHPDGAPPGLAYGKGWDAADAVAEGWTVREINRLIDVAAPLAYPKAKAADADASEPASLFEEIEFWHTPDKRPFASIRLDGHWETFALDSGAFKKLLSYAEYRATGKTMASARLEDTARQMQAQALFDGAERPASLRVGKAAQGYALDLGASDWSSVEITPEGWRVHQSKEPRFRRSPGTAALPVPVPGSGDVGLLRDFVNVGGEADFLLVLGWLLGALRPDGPYPILVLSGEQGSAKSTTTRVLRSLVDPSTLPARAFPGDERDLAIAAQGAHVLAFDNLSRIKPAMADGLCRLATGGGFATRKLHSDAEEVLFQATRPVILNGIPDLAERADLADRAITLTLPTIPETERAFESDFWERFEAARPRILAGLLDATSQAMADNDSVRLSERPRLADFARWVTAAEPTLGWPQSAFLAAYQANRRESEETAIDNNTVAAVVLAFVQSVGEWRGTASELAVTLRKRYPAETESAESFPRKPSIFGSELRRVAPLLRRQGVVIEHMREGKNRQRLIRLSLSVG
ncbi:hypothetical protein OEZ60_21510 [Defluviimonas sp. WL0024]|uniref:ATP-binding protein n=1 Tax=Albidovulum salinarum TaxID=2984153 RepID=A0ABT2X9C4_9RHOB|nr:hypothetical protein [Defluviimonas sp. WL0024]MCU9850556.1 hypothetical protein [Defluviimonas sp. WL0024]